MKEEAQSILNMTTATIGKDLLGAVVQELRLLPDVWPKLSKAKQDDVIERLRNRVEMNVKLAVHLIASDGRTVVAGDLDKLTIKDGVQALVKISSSAANLLDLYEQAGQPVLLVVANPAAHTGGMEEIKGESDQRAMDLGKEYKPDGDGDGMEGGPVVDAEFKELPQLGNEVLQAELDKAFDEGYEAAAQGKPESDCPRMRGELCTAWVKGHQHYHAEHPTSNEQEA